MLSWETMLPALIVLTVGMAFGLWAAIAVRRRVPVEPMRDVLDDAEERVARLMAHLRELNVQKERIDRDTYAKELGELEAQAAHALRERDQLLAKRVPASISASATTAAAAPLGIVRFLRERPVLRGALWATCVFVVGGLLVYSLLHSPAPAAAPSEAMTDTAQSRVEMPTFIAAEAPTDDEVQALIARIKEDPHDVAATACSKRPRCSPIARSNSIPRTAKLWPTQRHCAASKTAKAGSLTLRHWSRRNLPSPRLGCFAA